jgi:hypothetical protein
MGRVGGEVRKGGLGFSGGKKGMEEKTVCFGGIRVKMRNYREKIRGKTMT